MAREILENCGFFINVEKSIENLTQVIEYLGLIVNSLLLSLSLRQEKLFEILKLCGDLHCIPFAQAHYRALQRFHIRESSRSNGNLIAIVSLHKESRDNLAWWAKNIVSLNGRAMTAVEPDIIIYSDASKRGWGGVQNGVTTRGSWTKDDRHRHINELELLVALFPLKAFTGYLRKVSVRLVMDNFTAVHYVNKSGGTKSAELNAIMLAIVSWCESRQIAIQAVYVPDILNVVADHQFRLNLEAGDRKLRSQMSCNLSSKLCLGRAHK